MKKYDPAVPAPGHAVVPDFSLKNGPSAPPVAGVPLYDGFDSAETRRFVVDGFKDIWAGALFLAVTFVTIVWGIVNYATNLQAVNTVIQNATATAGSSGGPTTVSGGVLVGVIFLLAVIGTVLAVGSLALMAKFSEKAIIVANVGAAILQLIAAIIALATGVLVAGILLLICGVLQLVWLYLVRARIPFSALLLKHATELLMRYHSVIVVNFALIGIFTGYFLFWSSMIFPYLNRSIQQTQDSNPTDGGLATLFIFFLFWTSQVIFNVMHVTASGVAATWYFVGSGAMPPNPTWASFKRAVTTSFGSICFGSMLVAIVKVLRFIAESHRRSDHPFVACVAECLLSCLERLLEYFNTYAFVHVAIYGCSYTDAAKRTWDLAKHCGFAAYFNDALVGTTVSMLALAVSAFVGVITAIASNNVALGAMVFCIAFSVHMLVFRALSSFVVTLFVCFAEQPAALQVTSPDLYSMLMQADSNGQL